MVTIKDLKKEALSLKNSQKSQIFQRYFKTGKGQYGEGDKFLGIMTPDMKKIIQKYPDLPLSDLQQLLDEKYHEYRSIALGILVRRYEKSSPEEKAEIVKFYLKNLKNINNWDLVDISAPNILGQWYFDKDKAQLYKFAESNNLWERRISIISTYYFIKKNQFKDSLKIAEILLIDKEDLIHKAVGWMLREIGKRDLNVEEEFLNKFVKIIPRTCLRYSIEKFPEEIRQKYLKM